MNNLSVTHSKELVSLIDMDGLYFALSMRCLFFVFCLFFFAKNGFFLVIFLFYAIIMGQDLALYTNLIIGIHGNKVEREEDIGRSWWGKGSNEERDGE